MRSLLQPFMYLTMGFGSLLCACLGKLSTNKFHQASFWAMPFHVGFSIYIISVAGLCSSMMMAIDTEMLLHYGYAQKQHLPKRDRGILEQWLHG